MLTDDEIEAVILACMATEGGASEADMERAVDWAAQTRIASLVLDMVLAGDLAVSIGPDGEPVFSAREGGGGGD